MDPVTNKSHVLAKACACGFGCGWMDGMDAEEAIALVKTKLRDLLNEPFQVVDIVNSGYTFTVNIKDTEGKFINRLSIDKQTGRIRFDLGPLQVVQPGGRRVEVLEIPDDREGCSPDSCEC